MSEPLGRILVTGANGHLGRRLIARVLAGAGPRAPVRAVVRSERAGDALRALPEAARPEIAVLDYRDADALARAAEGCRHAVHLVGILLENSRSRYADAHEATAEALARAAEKTALRSIATVSILGSHPDSENPCLASKGRAERILLAAPTPALVLRVPMVIGPDDHVSRELRRQAQARVVPLLRGGASREQPLDADDLLGAILSGLARPELGDAAIDLAGPESLSRRELLARCAALYGNQPRVVPVPRGLALAAAALAERLSRNPPVSRAMLDVLDHDDDIDPGPACRRLGISLTPLDETLRRCVGPTADA